ncbi:50S ribosomal protein L21 [Chloroflexota bacterium]
MALYLIVNTKPLNTSIEYLTLAVATGRIDEFRRIEIYAIIETGGKQYKVSLGQAVDVERLAVAEGDTIELDKVLLIADGDKLEVGTPTVDGAKVVATSQGEGKGKKIIVLKYKPKVRYRKKTGHRQFYTRLVIDKIIGPGAVSDEPAKKVRRRKKEVIEGGA